MGSLDLALFTAWVDGQTVTALEYKKERELLRVAVNDNFARLIKSYKVLSSAGVVKATQNLTDVVNTILFKEGFAITLTLDNVTSTLQIATDIVALDNRYYTEEEVDSRLAQIVAGQITPNSIDTAMIIDGTITDADLSNAAGQIKQRLADFIAGAVTKAYVDGQIAAIPAPTSKAYIDNADTLNANDIDTLFARTSASGFRDGIEVDTTGLGGYFGLKLYENPQGIMNNNRFTEAKSNIYNTGYSVSLTGSMMRRLQRCAMVTIRPTTNKYLYSIIAFYELQTHHWNFIASNNSGAVKIGNVTTQNDSVFNSSTDSAGAGCFTGNPAHPIAWGLNWDNAAKSMRVQVANMGDTPAYTIDFTMEVIMI